MRPSFRLIKALAIPFFRLTGWLSNWCPAFLVRGTSLRFYLPPNEASIIRDAVPLERGIREPELLDWLDAFPGNCTFIDVGSSYGQESLYVAKRYESSGARVYAFNADPYGSYLLAVNREVNHAANLTFTVAVVAEAAGWTTMSFRSDRRAIKGMPRWFQIEYQIRKISLDDFCQEHALQPERIKIDVDGGELSVLKGATNVLCSPQLESVFVEVDHSLFGDVHELLKECGLTLAERVTYEANSNCVFSRLA